MKKEQKRKLFLIWDILLSLLLVGAGACLMVQCYRIYRSGSYTPGAVAAAFRPIRVPVYTCIVVAVLRLLGRFFEEEAPRKQQRQLAMVYRKVALRADMAHCPQPEKTQILVLREGRQRRLAMGWILFALCSAAFLFYALQSKNFTEDVTGSVVTAVWLLAAAMVLPFVWAVTASYKNRASMEAELALLKNAPKLAAVPAVDKKDRMTVVRLSLLAAAVMLIVVGLNLGGTRDVLTKAINICTECVGLG